MILHALVDIEELLEQCIYCSIIVAYWNNFIHIDVGIATIAAHAQSQSAWVDILGTCVCNTTHRHPPTSYKDWHFWFSRKWVLDGGLLLMAACTIWWPKWSSQFCWHYLFYFWATYFSFRSGCPRFLELCIWPVVIEIVRFFCKIFFVKFCLVI